MTLRTLLFALAGSAALAISGVHAADTTSAAGATGQCNDGTYTTSATKRGACSDHGGVKSWSGKAAPMDEQVTPDRNATAQEPARSPGSTMSTASGNRPTVDQRSDTPAARTAGGDARVWVNTRSNVYHCEGDRWYGKTKHGEYMTERDALAKGAHADHGKAC